jgi:hypothetical protein
MRANQAIEKVLPDLKQFPCPVEKEYFLIKT